MKRRETALMAMLIAALLITSCTSVKPTERYGYESSDPNALYYTNPIVLERADPWIYEHTDGYYYMMASVPEYDRLELRRSQTMTGLAYAEPVTVWEKNESGIMSKNIWAPEIYHIDGKWYIYFSAARADREFDHRMYVLENASANPLEGEWELKGQIRTGYEVFQIDASLFEHDDIWYMMWSGAGAKGNTLYMAQMENPWTLSTSRIMLTEPEYEWEQRAVVHVTEAPEVIKYNDRIYLTYSASFCDANYNMGLLTASADSDLMNPASWEKSEEPIFVSNPHANAYGPGHGSFLISRDSSERVHVYHAVDGQGPGYGCDKARNVRLQTYSFDEAGELQLGSPVSRGFTLPTPSGEARFELEQYASSLSNEALVVEEYFSGGKGIRLGKRSEKVKLAEVRAPETGLYALTLSYSNGGNAAKQPISINGRKVEFEVESNAAHVQSSLMVELKGGVNELELRYGDKLLELDYVELSYIDLAAGEAIVKPGLALTRTTQLEALAEESSRQLVSHTLNMPEGYYTVAAAYRAAAADASVAIVVNEESIPLQLESSSEWAYSSVQLKLSDETKLQLEKSGEVELAYLRVLAAPPEHVELRFVNRQTGIALQPNNGSKEAGEGYRQYKITDTPAQKWQLEREEDGSYYLKNAISGLYMTVRGERAVQEELSKVSEQRWLLQYAAEGSYRIVSASSGLAPTAIAADPNLYENLSFEAVDGRDAQVWYLTQKE